MDVEGSVDSVVNVPRTMRNVNLDITPTFVLGPCAVLSRNVRASLSVEQANDGVSTEISTRRSQHSLFDLVNLFAILTNVSALDRALTLEKYIVDDLSDVLLSTVLHFILELLLAIHL